MNFTLSRDKLLMLCDLLRRLEDAEGIFQDMAERQGFWHIQAQLDKELAEPFQADYPAILEAARRVVRKKY